MIPDSANPNRVSHGTVVASYKGSPFKKNQTIFYNKCTDFQVTLEGEKYSILRDTDIIGLLEGKGEVTADKKGKNF